MVYVANAKSLSQECVVACLTSDLLFVFACMFSTGHRPPAAGLGDHTGLECQLGHLEGWSFCCAADREYGERSTGHVPKTPRTAEQNRGQFSHPELLNNCSYIITSTVMTCNSLGLVSYK